MAPPKKVLGRTVKRWGSDAMQRHSNSGNGTNQAVDFVNSEVEMTRLISHIRSECLSAATTLSSSSGDRESCEPYQIEMGKVGE